MKKFFNLLLDLIYRKKCYFCRSSKYSVKMCPNCFEKLEFSDFKVNRIINGTNIYCAGIYTKYLQKLIRGLKYHKQTDLAFYQAKYMYEYFKNIKELQNKNFILVPVPLHKNRIKKRKYNHMELVCQEFSKLSGFDCNFEIITRIKDTKPQYKLSKQQRLVNLDKAFFVDKTKYNNQPILLMDDICTTGSTFEEIIKELKNNEIIDITCFSTTTP